MYFCKNCGRLARPGEPCCPKCGTPHAEPPHEAAHAAPQYHPAEDTHDVPAMGYSSTLGTLIIFAIPVVGFIMMLVWSFSDAPDNARKRLARAYLTRTLIVAAVIAALLLLGAVGLAAVTHSMYYYLR